jgi:peptidyl-prolyl cis-trans isomerase SurA
MNFLPNYILKTNLLLLLFFSLKIQAQVLDQIIAVVGNSIILQSELEAQYAESVRDNMDPNVSKCKILEELLFQKLLVAQGKKDSIEVTDAQVDHELDSRMLYYLRQFGSEQRFTAFYGKTPDQFKNDMRDNVKDILIAQQMQNKIIGDIKATPSDVKQYYYSIPEDSIPFINIEVEVGQIVKKPVPSEQSKKDAKEKIENIRQRILKRESSFAAMAALYSDDPGSASKGGLYEHVQRGQFVPEWEAWAFRLKPYEISEVFETFYGYFIIQLIERRGNEVDARSLLVAPKVDMADVLKAKQTLDSIYSVLKKDSTSFAAVAEKHSDEGETKHNGGLIINPFTGSTRFQMDELGQYDQSIVFAIEKLAVGQFTPSLPMTTADGKQAYRILYLKTKTQPHRANLAEDYQAIQAAALAKKQQDAIKVWVRKKIGSNFIRVNDQYKNCTFNNKWIN